MGVYYISQALTHLTTIGTIDETMAEYTRRRRDGGRRDEEEEEEEEEGGREGGCCTG